MIRGYYRRTRRYWKSLLYHHQRYAEVTLPREGQTDVVVSRLGPGQYFGEVELMMGGGRNVARVRAARDSSLR
jgi:CRP-like cAMP-binding protein